MLSSIYWLRRVGLVAVCLGGTLLLAQNDPISRRAAIERMYPVMLGELEAKNFGRARNICDQAIMWEPQNPTHHYNLACIEAQAGGPRVAYAWGALELAIALGFDDAEHLQLDPDLAPLRDDPRFGDLVRKVIHNGSAAAAVAGIIIPPARRNAVPAPADPVDFERPAPAAFEDEMPVGLYLMSRYHADRHWLEESVWYFAPDHSVHRDLCHGFSAADLTAQTGPRGTARRREDSLEIIWSDGREADSPLERDGPGFTWAMGIFSPVVAFENASEVAGVYEGSSPVPPGGRELPVIQRLALAEDGSFRWDGVSFADNGAGSIQLAVHDDEVTTGHWRLEGFSLILKDAKGATLRRIVFPRDDEMTVIKPDKIFLGGVTYKRRP